MSQPTLVTIVSNDQWRLDVTEQIKSGLISRRTAFSFLAALGVAAPVTIISGSAEAQTPGMQRREDRRDDRQERREDRRDDRQDQDNAVVGTGGQPATKGGTKTPAPK
jgi:hypothetical protein